MGYREEIRDILSCIEHHSNHFIGIHNSWEDKNYIPNKIEKNLDYLLQRVENNLPIYFLVEHEIIDNKRCFDDIIYNIEKYNLTTALISQATISSYKYSTHPLTNLWMWQDLHTRKSIAWNSVDEKVFDEYENEEIRIKDRKYKGICSVRKQSALRTSIMRRMHLNDSLVRYAKWPNDANNPYTNSVHKKRISKFPTLKGLLKEYENSYFSFVIESGNSQEMGYAQLSEKCLIAFMTGTLPIIFGDNNLIKDLEKVGLTTWNTYFGFNTDSYIQEEEKVNNYIECVKEVNKLSLEETKNFYKDNFEKVRKNYNIIYNLIFFKNNLI